MRQRPSCGLNESQVLHVAQQICSTGGSTVPPVFRRVDARFKSEKGRHDETTTIQKRFPTGITMDVGRFVVTCQGYEDFNSNDFMVRRTNTKREVEEQQDRQFA